MSATHSAASMPAPSTGAGGRARVRPRRGEPRVIFLGWWSGDGAPGDAGFRPPGLLTVLVVIDALWLLVTRRYPRDVFDLVVGICRWTVRVVAYAALMRDEYPPFRLGR